MQKVKKMILSVLNHIFSAIWVTEMCNISFSSSWSISLTFSLTCDILWAMSKMLVWMIFTRPLLFSIFTLIYETMSASIFPLYNLEYTSLDCKIDSEQNFCQGLARIKTVITGPARARTGDLLRVKQTW